MGILSKDTSKIPINSDKNERYWVFFEKISAVYPYVNLQYKIKNEMILKKKFSSI